MGMCAIYTSIAPPSAEELAALAKQNEGVTYGAHRCTLGRKAVAELVLAVAPDSHKAIALAIHERDLWSFLTPAASRGNHAAQLQAVHPDLSVPYPLWPSTTELACLVGAPPAHYIGNNLVMLGADLVAAAVPAFERHERTSEVAAYLNEFLRRVVDRKDAALLHWDHR